MFLETPATALLVIDVQEGMFSLPNIAMYREREFLSNVSDLVSSARTAHATVIYTQYCGPAGEPLASGSPGNRIHAAVAPQAGDVVIQKDDSDGSVRTELQEELQRRQILTLVACGLQSEFCVDSTCRTAYGLGYTVVLVADAHTTADAGSLTAQQIIDQHNATLGRAFVTVRTTADLCQSARGETLADVAK